MYLNIKIVYHYPQLVNCLYYSAMVWLYAIFLQAMFHFSQLSHRRCLTSDEHITITGTITSRCSPMTSSSYWPTCWCHRIIMHDLPDRFGGLSKLLCLIILFDVLVCCRFSCCWPRQLFMMWDTHWFAVCLKSMHMWSYNYA